MFLPEGNKSDKLELTEMMASTSIDPPKHGYVLTVSNLGRTLIPFAQLHHVSNNLCNCANGVRADHGKDVCQRR